jgi:hypothetical protein
MHGQAERLPMLSLGLADATFPNAVIAPIEGKVWFFPLCSRSQEEERTAAKGLFC